MKQGQPGGGGGGGGGGLYRELVPSGSSSTCGVSSMVGLDTD